MDEFSVRPETRSGDPFAFAGGEEIPPNLGEFSEEDSASPCPGGCYEGFIYLGHMEVSSETGEETEVTDRVRCKACLSHRCAS